MSTVYITSDLHLGHKNIHKFRCRELGFFRNFDGAESYTEWLYDQLAPVVTKRDTLIVLGDCCFTPEALEDFNYRVRCNKILVKGNHDFAATIPKYKKMYDDMFSRVEGLYRYKGQWLSHAPIHPDELRGSFNFHGHLHYHNIEDPRYFNCCIENMLETFDKPLATWQDVLTLVKERNR